MTGLTALELDVKDENGEIGFAPGVGSPGEVLGRGARLLRPARGRASGACARDLSHRAHRHVRGSRALTCEAGSRDPTVRRLGLEGRGWLRVDEPVRQARLEVQRRRRGRGGPGGIRRDHVRLRPLPVRRGCRSSVLRRTAARSASARRSRPSCATRIAGSTRTASVSPLPCSGCLRRVTSASARSPGGWRRISTRCTR